MCLNTRCAKSLGVLKGSFPLSLRCLLAFVALAKRLCCGSIEEKNALFKTPISLGRSIPKFSLVGLLCLLGHVGLLAQDTIPLRVGLHHDPPFIIEQADGSYAGLCIDLWQDIAAELGYEYTLVPYSDVIGMIRALDFQELDIAINPLTVSSARLRMLEASQPFYVSSVGVATSNANKGGFQVFLSNFFSLDFFKIAMALLFIIFCFGTLLWLVERNHNQVQFRPGLIGLLDGLWWSAVTMTTVGYGDKSPKTQLGRTIAIVWMFTAVIIISGFTASIASSLTVNSLTVQIEQLQDLQTVKSVGSVKASGSEDFLLAHDVRPHRSLVNPTEGIRSLATREIDVLVFDKTTMRYLINQEQLSNRIQLLPLTFNKQYRSFLFPKGSPFIEDINPVLVDRIQRANWEEVLKKYDLADD